MRWCDCLSEPHVLPSSVSSPPSSSSSSTRPPPSCTVVSSASPAPCAVSKWLAGRGTRSSTSSNNNRAAHSGRIALKANITSRRGDLWGKTQHAHPQAASKSQCTHQLLPQARLCACAGWVDVRVCVKHDIVLCQLYVSCAWLCSAMRGCV